jgi:hypothetical protein
VLTPDQIVAPAISIMAFAALFYTLSRTVADPDLWGHVRFGMDILRSGHITRVDPYSYLTAGTPWINHEWLAEVIYGAAYLYGGTPGIVLVKTALGILLFGIMYRYLRNIGLNTPRAWIVVFASAPPLIAWFRAARPQAFTFLALAILLLILATVERGDKRWLLVAWPLFAAWVNLHGGFLAGLGILAIWLGFWLLARCLEQHSLRVLGDRQSLSVIGMAAFAASATLLNPYGPHLLDFLFRTATVKRPEIVEWQPMTVVSSVGMVLIPILALTAISLTASRRKREPTSYALLITAALLPFLAVRFVPISTIIVVFAVAPDAKAAWDRLDEQRKRPDRSTNRQVHPWFWVALVASATIVGIGSVGLSASELRCIRVDDEYYPVSAVALMKASSAVGNLAVSFNWGEYLIWHLAPDVKVSVDGRRETVYSDEIRNVNLDFRTGRADWQALLRDYPTELVLMETDRPADNLVELTSGWTSVYSDSVASLYVRTNSAAEHLLADTSSSPKPADGKQCFP